MLLLSARACVFRLALCHWDCDGDRDGFYAAAMAILTNADEYNDNVGRGGGTGGGVFVDAAAAEEEVDDYYIDCSAFCFRGTLNYSKREQTFW
jgi:hypothetical protein